MTKFLYVSLKEGKIDTEVCVYLYLCKAITQILVELLISTGGTTSRLFLSPNKYLCYYYLIRKVPLYIIFDVYLLECSEENSEIELIAD